MPAPPLADDLVALRPWTERDVPFVVAACRDPAFERFTAAVPSPYGEADARAWLASQEPARRAGRSLGLAVVGGSARGPHPRARARRRLVARAAGGGGAVERGGSPPPVGDGLLAGGARARTRDRHRPGAPACGPGR